MKKFTKKLHDAVEEEYCNAETNSFKCRELQAILEEVRFALQVIDDTKDDEVRSVEIIEKVALLTMQFEALTNKVIK